MIKYLPLLFGVWIFAIILSGCSGSSTGSLSSDAPPAADAPKLLVVSPLTKTIALGGTLSLEASGGTDPYTFDVYYGNGSVTSSGATGTYQAPLSEGAAVIRVQDSVGDTGYATVEITNAPVIQPTSKTLAVTNKFPFAVLSGKAPYAFSITSGEGAINATTGEFTASANAGAVVIRVIDADSKSADANVTVNAALAFANKNIYVEAETTNTLSATGGVAPYTYMLASGSGSVDKTTGVYTAPKALGVATVNVIDSLGNFDTAVLNITTSLRINPATALVAKNSSLSFSAIGGVPPYTYAIQTGGIGGVLIPGLNTTDYSAPATTGTVTLRVTDSLGHTSDSSVTVTDSLTFNSANLILAVGNTYNIQTLINGGVAPLTYTVPSGQGSFSGSIYTAPNSPGVYTITVYDSQSPTANSAITQVVVNSAISLLPASATMVGGSQKSFTASGGVPPYTYSIQSPGGGSITAADGLYTAPASSASSITLLVTDARGNTATAIVSVQEVLAIVPTTKTLAAGESFTFTASGGITPYSFTLLSGAGAIHSSSGLYMAPSSSGLASVRVEDAAGNKKDALVTILNPLSISPPTISLIRNGAITFTATGGAGPYSFSVASGEGSVNATTGVFTAPATAGSSTVRVTDSLGSIKDAIVTIYNGLSISPFTKNLSVNQTFTFTANGGTTPYTYSLVSGVGSISADGAYSSTAAGNAIVRVTDASANTSEATVAVSAALAINPTSKTLGVNNQFTFSAIGGIPPYAFSILSGGGTVTTAGDYKAPTAGTSSVVRVTDSSGSTADATITVNDALTISPASVTLAAGGTQSYITAGGVAPYTYTAVSGGGSFTSATFTAPAVANGASVSILVTDSLGNTANATVTINPILVTISSPNSSSVITSSNKAAFAVSGTCSESGRSVTIAATGGITPSTQPTCTSGAWSTTLNLTSVADGSVTITANHANSNSVAATQASVTLSKDGTNPTITITSPTNGSYLANSVTVSGSCTKVGRVDIAITGGITAVTSCDGSTYSSSSLNLTSLTDGTLTITADHSDSAGNAATQALVSVTKDTVAPTISAFAITNSSPTNVTSFGLTFTTVDAGAPTSQYCILENLTTVASCSWLNTPLPTTFTVTSTNNDKVLSAWVKDSAGNISTRLDSNMVHLDNATPTIAISVPAASAYVNATNVSAYTVSGSCNKEGGTINIKAGSTSIGTATCTTSAWSTSTANFSSIAEGAIALTAVLTDLASNTATSAVVSITKDTIAPVISAFAVTNSSPTNTTSYGLTFTATGTPTQYCILENSTTVGNCSWLSTPLPTAFTVNSTNNSKTLSAWIKDAAGNVSTKSDSNAVSLDNATPTIAINVPAASAYVNASNVSSYTVSGTCNKESGTVNIKAGSTSVGTATCASSAWSTSSADFTSIAEGAISLTAVLTDLASNTATSAAVSITKDVALPTAPMSLDDQTYMASTSISPTVTFTSGTDTAGSGIQKHQIQVVLGSNTATVLKTWADFTSGAAVSALTLTDAVQYKVQIKAIDNAGNASTVTTSDGWIVDVAGPTTPSSIVDGTWMNSTTTSPTITFTGSSAASGIQKYQIQVVLGSNTATVLKTWADFTSGSTVTGLTLTDGVQYKVQIKAIDNIANESSIATSDGWSVDTTAPSAPSSVVDGTTSGSLSLSPGLSWVASSDSTSGVSSYEVAIGTTAGGTQTQTWTSVGNVTTATVTGLSLTPGSTYYSSVRAIDNIGNTSTVGQGDGWTAPVSDSGSCPTGYVQVPALTSYTTADFCVAKYIASQSGSDGVSVSGVVPWVSITHAAAVTACQHNNTTQGVTNMYDIITNAEWQTVARNAELVSTNWSGGTIGSVGGMSIGHSDGTPDSILAASSDDVSGNCYGTGQTCSASTWDSQRRTLTLNNGNMVWDFGANVMQWTKDTNSTNFGAEAFVSQVTVANHTTIGTIGALTGNAKFLFGPTGDYTALSSGQYGGLGVAAVSYTAGSVLRGGRRYDANYAGLFASNLSYGLEANANIGFRCVFHPNPVVPSFVNDGTASSSLSSSPEISWTVSTSTAGSITGYEVAIGTTVGGTQIKNWTSVGNVTTATMTGLSLTSGTTYYASVRATDSAGSISLAGMGNGWLADSCIASIGSACTGGAIYLGSLSPGATSGAGTDQYMTTPGGCGEIPAGQIVGSGASAYPNADFTPTCSGTDSLTKYWNDGTTNWYDIPGLTNYSSTSGVGNGASNTDQYYGSSNTTNIVAITAAGSGGYHAVARYCDKLSYGGYTDWYLPNRYELNLMWASVGSIPGLDTSGSMYLSSTEGGTSNAVWVERFSDGLQQTNNKSDVGRVRCVRRF